MSDRLKEIMADIVNHCDSGADNNYEIKITNGDLIRWYDGLEVVQAQMRDAAIQVERQNALLRPFVAVANDYKDDAKDAWFVPCPLGACREARKAVSSVEKLSDC